MATYLLRRLLGLVPLLLCISALSFWLVRQAPGSPFDTERAPASPEIERMLRAKYHQDEPFWKQYARYLGVLRETDAEGRSHWVGGGLLQGDLGPSMKYRNHSVNDIVFQGLPISMTLGFLAFCFAMGVGIPLGIYTALHRGEWGDYIGSFLALLAFCIPGLVVGPLLVMGFALHWHWFPVALWISPWHVVLPTVTLGLYFSGRVARLMREGMTESLREGYIMTARAKGVPESRVVFRHALPLAILPVVSYSGPLLADLLTGSFVVENLFRIPGIGVFLVNSALALDYNLVVGLALVYALLLVLMNLLVDVTYAFLDRRVKLG